MATQNWQPQQTNPPPAPAPQPGVTLVMPTTITLKDVVVIITALITIISSWTFYTMRLSVQEQKVSEIKVQMEKVQVELDTIHKDIQDLRMKFQVVEIKQSMSVNEGGGRSNRK